MPRYDDYGRPIPEAPPSIPFEPLTSPNDEQGLDSDRLNKAVNAILAERTARRIADILISVIIAIWFISNAWSSDEFVMFIFERAWGFGDLLAIIGLWILHSFTKVVALFVID